MLVYYFVPFIVSNRYLIFRVSSGHNSVTVQNRTHVYMNFFDHKDLGNHLQLCPKSWNTLYSFLDTDDLINCTIEAFCEVYCLKSTVCNPLILIESLVVSLILLPFLNNTQKPTSVSIFKCNSWSLSGHGTCLHVFTWFFFTHHTSGMAWIWQKSSACQSASLKVLNWPRWNSQHVSNFMNSCSSVFQAEFP